MASRIRAGLAKKLDHYEFVANNPSLFLSNYFIGLTSELDFAVANVSGQDETSSKTREAINAELRVYEEKMLSSLASSPVSDDELDKVRKHCQMIGEIFGNVNLELEMSPEDYKALEQRCELFHQELDRDLDNLKQRILMGHTLVLLAGFMKTLGVLVILDSIYLRDCETQFLKQKLFKDGHELSQEDIIDFLHDSFLSENRSCGAFKRSVFRNLLIVSQLPRYVREYQTDSGSESPADEASTMPKVVFQINAKTLEFHREALFDGMVEAIQPDALCGLKSLDLTGQSLTRLNGNLAASVSLEALSSAMNLINQVDHDAFDSLKSLRSLSLNGNLINIFDRRHFESLSKLQVLNLADNFLIGLSDDLFVDLEALALLDLSGNGIRTFKASQLANKVNLKTLNLCSNLIEQFPKADRKTFLVEMDFSFNCIQTLPPRALLNNYESLEILDLRNNLVTELNANTFQYLSRLKSLCLDDNTIRVIEPDAFCGLDSLTFLTLSGNMLESIGVQVFSSLTKLESLNLGANCIRHISREAFHGLSNLKHLGLSHNLLRTLEDEHLFEYLSLDSLDLSNNQIIFIKRGLLDKITQINRLDLSFNSLVMLQELTFLYSSNMVRLDLSHSRLGTLTPRMLEGLDNLNSLVLNSACIDEIDQFVFKGLVQLSELDLSNNRIKSIHPDAFFKLVNLNRLNLANNFLTSISSHTFKSLKSLGELDLSSNWLDQIEQDMFEGLVSLQVLHLNENYIEVFGGESWSSLPHLRELDLQKNKIRALAVGCFKHLTNLSKLNLDYNKLTELLEPGVFETLVKLRIINLRFNKITKIHPDVWRHLQSLDLLALSGNRIEIKTEHFKARVVNLENNSLINEFATSFNIISIKDNKIRELKITGQVQSIDASSNQIERLKFERSEQLRTLKLDDNKINHLEDDWFVGLTDLQELSIARNSVVDLESFFKIQESLELFKKTKTAYRPCLLPKLRQLSFKANQISELNNFEFSKLGCGLTRLELSENRLSALGSSFSRLVKLKELDLSKNSIETLSEDTFCGCRKISRIDLSHNKLAGLPVKIFANQIKLGHLNLAGNMIKALDENLLFHVSSLLSIDLSQNKLSSLDCSKAFQASKRLRHLNVSNNSISGLQAKSFDGFSKLVHLNLKENELEKLDSSCFSGLLSLTDLDLSGNKIQDIDRTAFMDLKRLKELDLSHNKLNNLGFFQHLTRLSRLNLSSNMIDKLETASLQSLESLEELNISSNFIASWTRDTSIEFKRLKILNLERNLMTQITPGFFKSFTRLEKLNLSNNRFEVFEEDAFGGLNNLKSLDVSRNPLRSLGACLKEMLQLNNLNVSKTHLTCLEESSFTEDMFLKELIASECQIETVVLRPLKCLEKLDLSKNKLTSVDKNCFKGLKSLEVLHLQENTIRKLDKNMFADCLHLRELNLDRNLQLFDPLNNNNFQLASIETWQVRFLTKLSLNGATISELQTGIFTAMPYLSELDLAFNNFDHLLEDWFKDANKLTRLNLSNNKLNRMAPLRIPLETLILSNNLFTSFKLSSIFNLSHLTNLDLSGNTIETIVDDLDGQPTSWNIESLNLSDYMVVKSMDQIIT